MHMTTITGISKIEIDKVSEGEDPWDHVTLQVTDAGGLQKSLILTRTDNSSKAKSVPHALANSYSAHMPNGNRHADFVVKLPNLTGVTESQDISERISAAHKMFQQEHQLRARLLPEPDVLPKFLSKKDDFFTLESKRFMGPVFYVARQFVEGRNL